MKDVGDGEIVAESGDHKGGRGENNESEDDNTGASSGLAKTLPARNTWKDEGKEANDEGIDAQRQCEEQGKGTDCRHVGRTPSYFFRNERERQPNRKRMVASGRLTIRKCSGEDVNVSARGGGRGSAARRFEEAGYADCWW